MGGRNNLLLLEERSFALEDGGQNNFDVHTKAVKIKRKREKTKNNSG